MFERSCCHQHADWPLLRDSAVNLFCRRQYLEEAVQGLAQIGYAIERIDCSEDQRFRADVSRTFRFAESFGYSEWTGNLDALDDAMWSVFDAGGDRLAVALTDFDRLFRNDQRTAESFADGFETHARTHLLFGCRMIALIQSSDPKLELTNLGARSAIWNQREWLPRNRGL